MKAAAEVIGSARSRPSGAGRPTRATGRTGSTACTTWSCAVAFEEGARLTSKYDYAGAVHDIEYEIAERRPTRRQVVRTVSGPFPFEGTLELAEAPEGTRVRQTIDAGSRQPAHDGPPRAGGPVLRRAA